MEINVGQSILAVNDRIAAENRQLFKGKKVFIINLMASPGAGKTSFVLSTIAAVKDHFAVGVIEGDIASKVDAEKVKETGVAVVQINTGGACHLDAQMIKKTLPSFELDKLDVLIIENVGNLVCPAEFDLGETVKVVILSVPEGHDKPLKYPVMFAEADVLILNKIDLLSGSDFDLEQFETSVRNLNPRVESIKLSCKTGEGLDAWTEWLVKAVASGQ
jgi:hydrogenase nickel incorporation protein HypB